MTVFVQSMRNIGVRGLTLLIRARYILIGLLVVCLGILVGQSIRSVEQGELVLSIVTVIALLVITFRKPLNALLLWIVLLPFLEHLINIPMGAGIPDLSFSRFLIAFISTAILARAAIDRERIQRIGLTEICILVTTLGVMSAAPLSIFPNATGVAQMSLAWYLQPMMAFFFAKNLVKNHDDLVKVFLAIGFLGFVSGVYAAYEHATGNVLFLDQGRSLSDVTLYREELGIRMIRGIYGSTGSMGRVLVLSIPVTLYLYLEDNKHRIPRIFLVVMLLAQFYGSVVAMARSPWYSLLMALFVMQLVYPKFRKVFLVIAVVAAIMLAVTWDQVADSAVASRVGDENSTLEGRQQRWIAGFGMWRAKPIRGWGFGHYAQESGRFRTDGNALNLTSVESDYLMILVSTGLIGFLPYMLTLSVPFLSSLFLLFETRSSDWPGFIDRGTIATYWATLIIYAVCSYTATIVDSSIKQLTFAVTGTIIGTHAAYLQRQRQSKGKPSPDDQNPSTIERVPPPGATETVTTAMPVQGPQTTPYTDRQTRPLHSLPEAEWESHRSQKDTKILAPGPRKDPTRPAHDTDRRTAIRQTRPL